MSNFIYIILSIIALETSYLTALQVRNKTVKAKQRIVLDTSALIDGRIVSVARSGFISAQLVIPRSVVRELQYMADKADHDKRERARYGLDVIQTLQGLPDVNAIVYDDGETHQDGVDEQLITLAKKLSARLCTTDYNLNKVAKVESIKVVNVNELAHALRPMHLPGEIIMVAVVHPGQGQDQGVGYLDDGTMVVVDHAKKLLNQTIEAETTRVLQTEAGRMVFARLVGHKHLDPKRDSKPSRTPNKTKRQFKRRTPEDSMVELANK